jgi:hypothetical protein
MLNRETRISKNEYTLIENPFCEFQIGIGKNVAIELLFFPELFKPITSKLCGFSDLLACHHLFDSI